MRTNLYGVRVFAVGPPAIRTAMTEFIMDDPGGREWRAGFKDTFEQGRDTPRELVANSPIELTDGKPDKLTDRHFTPNSTSRH